MVKGLGLKYLWKIFWSVSQQEKKPYLSLIEIWVFLNQLFFKLEKKSSCDELYFLLVSSCCSQKKNQAIFKTRHFKLEIITSSTKRRQKSSAAHCSRITRYPSFISQDFFHFSTFIHDGDNLNMSENLSCLCHTSRRLLEKGFSILLRFIMWKDLPG